MIHPIPTTMAEAEARRLAYEDAVRNLDWRDQPGSGGFSVNEMHVVFMKVADKTNWKLPVNWTGELSANELMILPHAVKDFTGGPVAFTLVRKPATFHVTARGYYRHIGA